MTQHVSRRTIASLAAATGIGAPLLAACGDDGSTVSDPSVSDPSSSPPTSAPTSASGDPSASESSGGGGGDGLASTSDIEVGGGTIFPEEEVVITQPTEGDFKGFSSTCTHQGCAVTSVGGGNINCPCHGSSFSIEDGSVTGGPASSSLPEVAIAVDGDQITLA